MKFYELKKGWFKKIDNQPFEIINVNTDNILEYEFAIKSLIENFHKRYEWDGFPKWEDVNDRLQTGKNIFFLCKYVDKIIGWVWFRIGEVDINKEHVKLFCKTNENEVWGYNNFIVSSKIIDKPDNSGTLWCNLMFEKLFDLGITKIYVDTESSNEQSSKMCILNGMQETDWPLRLISDVKDRWGN